MKLSPEQKLDIVLLYLSKPATSFKSISEVANGIKDHAIDTDRELFLILKKLKKDGYIETSPMKSGGIITTEDCYSISFDGLLLLEYGGYKEKISYEATMEIQVQKQNLHLRALKYIVALGTLVAALYYSIETGRLLGWWLSSCGCE